MQKLKINKYKDNKGEIRYYIASTIRNGKKNSTHNLVSLGKRSDLEKLYPDVDAFLKSKLDEAMESGLYETSVQIKYSFNKQIKENEIKQHLIGDIFIHRLINETHFDKLLESIQKQHRFKYSLKDIICFLVSQRMLTPNSKRKMFLIAKEKCFLTPSFSLENVYRAMDILLEHKTEILKWLYNNIPSNINRNYSVLYFDGTNTYMETEIEEGLKARGKGKRNEIEPLVSLGLIIDGDGIPLSYVTFKGSESECKQLIPLEEIIEKDFKHTDFTMITDAALSSREIRCFNSISNKNFITVIPVRKMSQDKLDLYVFDKKKPWKTNNEKYATPESVISRYDELSSLLESTDSPELYASYQNEIKELMKVFLTRNYPVKQDTKPKAYCSDNKTKEYIDENYIISFSLKYALRDRKQRNNLIERAAKIITKEGTKQKYKPGDPRRYVKSVNITENGEAIENVIKELDEELILKQSSLDGYYAVSTSLIKEKEENVISWMKKRWMIEDTFLVMKQFLAFRPINHSKDNRIDAHFFTVFLTTLFYRYIQTICNNSDYSSLKDLSDESLFDLLRSFEIVERKDYYFPNFRNSIEQQEIQSLFNVNISNEIMKKSYISKEYKKIFSK